MKYSGMPAGMWMYYKGAFRKALVKDLGYTPAVAAAIAKSAEPGYRGIIGKLPRGSCLRRRALQRIPTAL